MRRLLKWFLILGVVVAVLAVASISAKSWWEHHSVPKYLTADISRGRVETVVNSTGTVKPVQSVTVGAFTSGPIKDIKVDFNSLVKKGDLLALIDPRLAEAQLSQSQAALEAQQADLKRVEALLKQAENNEKRARKLMAVNKDFLSETDMDTYYFTRLQYEAQLRLGEASIRQAQATLENAKTNLGYCEIHAPVDGMIVKKVVEQGQTVASIYQTPELFVIATEMEKHMYIFANVDEADIGQVLKAQAAKKKVRFTVDSYPDDCFEGTIFQVRKNATTTQNVVTYPVVIEARNSRIEQKSPAEEIESVSDAPAPNLKLLPDMTASISFEIEAKDNVVRLPAAALRYVPMPNQVRAEDRHYIEATSSSKNEATPIRSAVEKADLAKKRQHRIVWVQDGQLLRAVPVTLGLIDNQNAELLEGDLEDGQALVVGVETMK